MSLNELGFIPGREAPEKRGLRAGHALLKIEEEPVN
jgi:hypothetical protein